MGPAMKRFDTWPTQLERFIELRRETPFVWGRNDCTSFACDAVLAMTGVDLAADFRETYHDVKGALRLLGDGDVGDLASRIALVNDIKEVPVAYARRGDVVLINQPELPALGIVSLSGEDIWAPGEKQIEKLPLSLAVRAWRI